MLPDMVVEEVVEGDFVVVALDVDDVHALLLLPNPRLLNQPRHQRHNDVEVVGDYFVAVVVALDVDDAHVLLLLPNPRLLDQQPLQHHNDVEVVVVAVGDYFVFVALDVDDAHVLRRLLTRRQLDQRRQQRHNDAEVVAVVVEEIVLERLEWHLVRL